MTVVVVSRVSWNMQTVRNVTSISISGTNYVIVGDSTVTVPIANYFVRIME